MPSPGNGAEVLLKLKSWISKSRLPRKPEQARKHPPEAQHPASGLHSPAGATRRAGAKKQGDICRMWGGVLQGMAQTLANTARRDREWAASLSSPLQVHEFLGVHSSPDNRQGFGPFPRSLQCRQKKGKTVEAGRKGAENWGRIECLSPTTLSPTVTWVSPITL